MRRPLLYLAAAALGIATPARADFVITVPDATIAPGGTVTLAVTIRSTGAPIDQLDTFGFSFQVATAGPSRLEFTPTQPDPFAAPDYVLFGASGDQDTSQPLGTVGTTVTPNDTSVGGDETPLGVSAVPVSGTDLLAYLRLTAATALPPSPGDSFTVSLVSDPSFTFFMQDGSDVPFTATVGMITVSGVPEPGSGVALLCGGLAILASRRLSRNPRCDAGRGS